MRDELLKQKKAKEVETAPAPVKPVINPTSSSVRRPVQPLSTINQIPEPGSIDDKGTLDKVSEWWSDVSIMPDSLDNVIKPRPLSEVFQPKMEQQPQKTPKNVVDEISSYIKTEEGNYGGKYTNEFLGNWRKDKTNKGKIVGEVIGTGLNKKGLSSEQISEITKDIKNNGFLTKKVNDKIFNQLVTKLQKDFKKDMKGSTVTFGKLNPARKAALVAMGSQLGFAKTAGRGENSFKKMYAAIKNGDFNEAAKQVLIGKDGGRSQFSIDTPLRAGRVALMLREGKFQRGYGL